MLNQLSHFYLTMTLLYITIFNIVVSHIITLFFKIKKEYQHFKKNNKSKIKSYRIYYCDHFRRIDWRTNSDWLIEKIILGVVYFIYLRISLLTNIIKLIFKNNYYGKKNYNVLIDFLIILFAFLETLAYLYVKSFSYISEFFIISLLFWRILTIVFIRLNEILSFQFEDAKFRSFNRSFLTFFINFYEIIISFAFIYSSKTFFIKPIQTHNNIFKTISLFTDWAFISKNNLGCTQQFLIIFQILIFFLFISIFLTLLPTLSFTRKKEIEKINLHPEKKLYNKLYLTYLKKGKK